MLSFSCLVIVINIMDKNMRFFIY